MAKPALIVRDVKTREEVDRVELSSVNENHVERVMSGMLINMSPDYFVDDSEVDAARKKQERKKKTK
jgi:hypothetical protein